MESLAREKRYGSGSKRPASTQSTSSALADARRSPKKAKLSKREKRRKALEQHERELGVQPGEAYEPPSSQKRMKLEPAMYRALLEAASPRRRKEAAAAAAAAAGGSSSSQQQQQARKAGSAPVFRKIQQRPLPPPPFYPSPSRSSQHPMQDDLSLSPVRSQATQGGFPPRPTGGPNDRDATPLFLPEFDDELAGRIIARGEARDRAAAAARRDAAYGSPSRGAGRAAASRSNSASSSDEEGHGTETSVGNNDYERERFPDYVSETPERSNAEAGPSSTAYIHVFATDDEDDIEDADGGRGDDDDSATSPNVPGTSERSLDMLVVPTNVPGAIPVSVQAAQAAAAVATAALKSKSKGKKRAAPATSADETDPASLPRKITRNRESYQAKTTAMWMREQCLTAVEADERWERYLVGRGGHKGETFKLAMKQRESVLVSRWMLDDEIGFGEAGARMRALLDREEREKVARQKAARVVAAGAAIPVAGNSDSAAAGPSSTAAPKSPAKRTRKSRTSAANEAAATAAVASAAAAASSSTGLVPKPARSHSSTAVPPAAGLSSTAPATATRRKPGTTPTARAVELVCLTEAARSDEARLTIVDLFASGEGHHAEVYLSLPDGALRAAWVERRLREKGAA